MPIAIGIRVTFRVDFISRDHYPQCHAELVSASAFVRSEFILYFYITMVKLTNAFIYIMSNKGRTTFYIGVTNDLERRVKEHKSGKGSDFTSKYLLFELVYFEQISSISLAIEREKQLKRWHREWKINLIKTLNPDLIDLAKDWEQ